MKDIEEVEEESRFELSTVRSAVIFGFKGCEKGINLDRVINDFNKLMGIKEDVTLNELKVNKEE